METYQIGRLSFLGNAPAGPCFPTLAKTGFCQAQGPASRLIPFPSTWGLSFLLSCFGSPIL